MRKGYLLILVLLAGCTHMEKRSRQGWENGLYREFRISASEDEEQVQCRFRFLEGGPEGTAVSLPSGAKLLFDGQTVPADSAGLSGVFYETDQPLESFSGKHTIAFTDADHKTTKERFDFSPFEVSELPEEVRREPFTISLSGSVPKSVKVRLLLVDTAFSTNDVNEEMVLSSPEIPITAAMLSRLSSGPIHMEIIREEDRVPAKGYGRLVISYRVARELELKE